MRTCGLGNVKKLDKHSHLLLASGRQSESHLCVRVCVFVCVFVCCVLCAVIDRGGVILSIRVNMAGVSTLLATDQ